MRLDPAMIDAPCLRFAIWVCADATVSESDYDHEYSISSTVDSQEWVTETEDAASILLRSRTHNINKGDDVNKPSAPPPVAAVAVAVAAPPPSDDRGNQGLASKKPNIKANVSKKEAPPKPAPKPPPPAAPEAETEYLCSRCGRHEPSNMSEQAVVAAKVVVLLGKYGNRKGMRFSALSTNPHQHQHQHHLRGMIAQPSNDAISAFQNEVARMMLEGADVPELNMDVEQFIAGYMKLNSPFYIDLIQDFFKSVCIDCFGHLESGPRRAVAAPPQRPPAYAVLKARKTKTLKGNQ